MMQTGVLYLIPVTIADDGLHMLPAEVYETTSELQYYFVENVRSARRFLRKLHSELNIDNLVFSEIDKHNGADISQLKIWLNEGKNIGIMSEAGCPGIADPGAELVAAAHRLGAIVKPLTGPSSILLALMASGLNGQSFCFRGYLPIKEPQRSQQIKTLEEISIKENQTQIFIETPYRNNVLLADLIKHCHPKSILCVAQNLTGATESIRTMTVLQWKSEKSLQAKSPAVFLLRG